MAKVRSVNDKPVHPKNGYKYKNADGDTMIFRYGRWYKVK